MIIRSAVFTVSSPSYAKCPQDRRPEYAFIGRSNVGKSSLINMLTGVKGLAKTSGRPGKTQLINHFLINNEWYLVDLPGYGYAANSSPTPMCLSTAESLRNASTWSSLSFSAPTACLSQSSSPRPTKRSNAR